jgi:hypothetical protein
MRASKKNPAHIAVVLKSLRAGNTRTASADYAGIGRKTFYRWLESDDTFRHNVQKAEAGAEHHMLARVKGAADKGTWQAAAWWLERRRRDAYALALQHEHSGRVETSEITKEELDRRFDRIAASFEKASPDGSDNTGAADGAGV